MKKQNRTKFIFAVVLLIVTVIFAALDNEAIFPATLVGFFLVLTTFGRKVTSMTPAGKAARYTIISFSMIVIVFNVGATLFLPMIAASTGLTEHYTEMTTDINAATEQEQEDHFVAVTMNDAHELCFLTSFLLLLNVVFLAFFERKTPQAHSLSRSTG